MEETYEWKGLLDPASVVIEMKNPTGRGKYKPDIKSILKYLTALEKIATAIGKLKQPFVQVKLFMKLVAEQVKAAKAIISAGERISKKNPGGLIDLTLVYSVATRRVTIQRNGNNIRVLKEVVEKPRQVRESENVVALDEAVKRIKKLESLHASLQEYLETPWKCPPGKLIVDKKKEKKKPKDDKNDKQSPEKAAALEQLKKELAELKQDLSEDKAKLAELNKTSKELNAKRPDQKKVIANFDSDVAKAEKVLKSKSGTLAGYRKSLKSAEESLAKAKKANDDKAAARASHRVKWMKEMIIKYEAIVDKADKNLKSAQKRRKTKFTPKELAAARKEVRDAIKDVQAELKETEASIRKVEEEIKKK